jgi:hypothetical protein
VAAVADLAGEVASAQLAATWPGWPPRRPAPPSTTEPSLEDVDIEQLRAGAAEQAARAQERAAEADR